MVLKLIFFKFIIETNYLGYCIQYNMIIKNYVIVHRMGNVNALIVYDRNNC